jgi:deazaflavin-dependent oxidoreductase (nitroreductase family)
MARALTRAGVLRGYALIETTGRKSGLPRQVPVGGGGLEGDVFWLVAEHGHRADYVRNIEADPRVRVLIKRTWRTGTAHVLDDDDPLQRLRTIGRRGNALAVRMAGTDLLTIRVDLDPDSDDGDDPAPGTQH